MEEEIQSWLDSAMQNSQFQWEYWKHQRLPDIDGWGGTFASFLQDWISLSGRGILLTGADNHSKQAAALQMLELLASEGYEGVFLDGMELADCGAVQAKNRLDGLLDHYYDTGTGLCLILEGLEACPGRRELLRFLGQKLCEYGMHQDQLTPLFLILLDDCEQDIPALLRGCLQQCRLCLPNRERRAAYLKKQGKLLRNALSLDLFAQLTEGLSYIQLQDLIVLAQCRVDSRDDGVMSAEELQNFLADRMPPSPPEDAMQMLGRSMQQLLEQLPQLLQNAAKEGAVTTPMSVPKPTQTLLPENQDNYMANKRQEYVEMPPWNLFVEVLGEKAATELREMAPIPQ